MPNGWYPVEGLDAVLINRSEQRYPRIEWDQSWDRFFAAEFRGASGYAPRGELRFSASGSKDPAAELVQKAQEIVAGDPMQGTASASIAYVDFAKRTGFACGVFSVYAFGRNGVEILHDLTVGASLPAELHARVEPHVLGHAVMHIGAAGLHPPLQPGKTLEFRFDGAEALVVSSMPLHYDAHWPPKNSLDCVAIALANPQRLDTLIALWKSSPKER